MGRAVGGWALAVVGVMPCAATAGCGPGTSGTSGSGAGSSSSAMVSTGILPGTATSGVDDTAESTSTSATTPPIDDFPAVDVPPDMGGGCTGWATMGCGTPGMGGAVSGATPLGDFDVPFAAFGVDTGCAGACLGTSNIAQVMFMADPAIASSLEPNGMTDETLVARFDLGAFEGPIGRTVQATLVANRGGMSMENFDAELVLDDLPPEKALAEPFDPATAVVVTGTVSAQTDGWDVTGSFAAVYCPQTNTFGICE